MIRVLLLLLFPLHSFAEINTRHCPDKINLKLENSQPYSELSLIPATSEMNWWDHNSANHFQNNELPQSIMYLKLSSDFGGECFYHYSTRNLRAQLIIKSVNNQASMVLRYTLHLGNMPGDIVYYTMSAQPTQSSPYYSFDNANANTKVMGHIQRRRTKIYRQISIGTIQIKETL